MAHAIHTRAGRYAASAISLLLATSSLTHAQTALPQGGQVASGNATISHNGTNAVVIDQTSQRAVVNWQNFSIGQDASVKINQPNVGAAILNRVTGGTSSTIAGSLSGTGQIFLINPNGIAITSTGTVNVGGGFVASTLDIADADFMNGTLNFSGSGGTVSNGGAIQVGNGGFTALLGGQVSNSGSIAVPLGRIGIGSGQRATLDLSGDGFLQVALPTSDGGSDPLVQVAGQLSGARIEVRAATVSSAFRNAVNVPGELSAKGAHQEGGVVILDGGNGGSVQIAGKIDAGAIGAPGGTIAVSGRAIALNDATIASDGSTGGSVTLDASKALGSGTVRLAGHSLVSAAGQTGLGGNVTVTGDTITLADTSALSATGATGGGNVRVGGGWQGGGDLYQATNVTLGSDARIDVSATHNGNGGTAVLWSNVTDPASFTNVNGTIIARAAGSGNGGNIETSGHQVDSTGAQIDAGAPGGTGGLWLIDPADSTITQSIANSYATTLNTGTSVTNSVIGAMTWNSGVTLNKTSGGDATLTLQSGSGSSTTITSPITLTNATIGSTSGALNLVIWTQFNSPAREGAIKITGSTITTNGGHVWMGSGGTGSLFNGLTVGNAAARSYTLNVQGLYLGSTSITTGSGSISLAGTSNVSVIGSNGTRNFGVWLDTGTSLSTTSGTIQISGGVVGQYANGEGTLIGGLASSSAAGNVSVSSGSGAISISGTAGDTLLSPAGYRNALSVVAAAAGDQTVVKSTSGAIALNGAAALNSTGLSLPAYNYTAGDSSGVRFRTATATSAVKVITQSGPITITGSNNYEALAVGISGVRFDASNAAGSISIGRDGATIDTGAITINANSISQKNTTATAGSISVQSTGALAIRPIGNSFTYLRNGAGALTFDNNWSFGTALSGFTLGSTTNTYALAMSNDLSVDGAISITGGSVALGAALASTGTSNNAITLTALGTGGITSTAAGTISNTGALTLSLNNASANSTMAGVISGAGTVTKAGAGTLSLSGANTYTGTTTIAAGTLAVGAVNSLAQDSALTIADGATLDLAGNSATVGSLAGAGTVTNRIATAAALTAGRDNTSTTFSGVIQDGSGTVQLSKFGSGTLTLSGANTYGGRTIIRGGTLDLSGSWSPSSGDANVGATGGGSFVGNGVITAATFTVGFPSTGVINLTGPNQVDAISTQTLAGSLSFNNARSISVGSVASSGSVTVKATGATSDITLASGAVVSSMAGGDAVTLAAGRNFINNAGSSAVSTPSGRWQIFSAAPANDVFGNLDSGHTAVWNTSYTSSSGSVSQTGNRYVFAISPTLTVTPQAATKTYGDDVTSAVASSYTITGVDPGVAGAYLADSAATAYSGTPAVTSVGSNSNANAGTYDIDAMLGSLTALIGYSLSLATPATLTINKAALTVTANNAAKTYDGLAFNGGSGVTYAGFVNGETSSVLGGSLTYGGSAQGAINAGSYGLTASGLTSGNYALSYTAGTLNVGKAALTVTASDATKTYDGLAFNGGNGVTYAGFVNGETSVVLGGSLAYGGTSQGAINAGSYGLTASGLTSGNYALSYTAGTLNVGKAALTVTASDATKTYDGLAFNGGNGVTYAGFVNGETSSVLGGSLAYGGSAQGAINAGSYGLTASGLTSGNYALSYTAGTLNVGQAALTVTANNAAKTYDGLAFNGGNGVTYAGFVNGETSSVLGGSLTYGGSAQGAVNAGSYGLTASGLTSGNYALSYTAGTLNVGKAALTVTASDATKTYDGLAFNGGNGVTYAGFVNGETSSVLGGSLAYGGSAQGAINAGSYGLTASGLTSGNYALSYTAGTLNVGKAALTVTASDATKTYDGLAFNGGNGVTYAGFVNGETSSVLSGSLAYGGSAQGAINAGSYGLTASGLTSGNYALSYTAGTLNVGQAALTVTANNATKTYDGLAFNGGNGVTYAGFVNGETSSVLGGSLAYGGSAQGAINAGSYGLTASGLTSGNYAIGYTAGTLNVGKAALTVTASDATKTYDGLAFNGGNGVTYAGFVNGETSAVLGGSLAYGGSAQGAINAGSYGLTASGLTSGNYALSYNAGTLNVGQAALTVTANDAAKTYDGLAFNGGNGVAYAGFVNGETSVVLGGSLAYGGSAQGAVNAGSYGLTASGLTSGNYAIGYTAGTLTVGKAALTVTANDAAKTYDGLAFNGGNGVTYAGFVNGQTSSVLGGSLAYGGSAQGAINAGSYSLTASGLTSGNYSISYVSGSVGVAQRRIVVTAQSLARPFGTPNPSLTYTVGGQGIVAGDSLTGALSTSAMVESLAGAYAIERGTLSANANYMMAFIPGTLTVHPVFADQPSSALIGRYPSTILRQPLAVRSFDDLDLRNQMGCSADGAAAHAQTGSVQISQTLQFCAGGKN